MFGAVTTPEINDSFSGTNFMEGHTDELGSNELVHAHRTTQILLTTKPPIHIPEAGVNPLVDAASYVFSIMGKLHHTKYYKNLEKLHAELFKEIENFRDTVQSLHYKADYLDEYILISCYALCSALDNIIANTTWGNQGKWSPYSLIHSFNKDSLSHENILIILERLVCAPDIYIDVMEFIYICLNLGLTFSQSDHLAEFTQEQLEQITYSLYKRIRGYRGNYSKVLSPFAIKPVTPNDIRAYQNRSAKWLKIMLTGSIVAAFFTGVNYWVDQQLDEPLQQLSQTELRNHEKSTNLHAHTKKISNALPHTKKSV